MIKYAAFLIAVIIYSGQPVYSQANYSVHLSEAVITYTQGINQPGNSLQMPFDKRIALLITKEENAKDIKLIYVYEAKFKNGVRDFVPYSHNGKTVFLPDLTDKDLRYDVSNDTVLLHLPCLKPSVSIDIVMIKSLSEKYLQLDYLVNEALYKGKIDDARSKLHDLWDATYDHVHGQGYFAYQDIEQYQEFYNFSLSDYYTQLHNPASYTIAPFLTMDEVNIAEAYFRGYKFPFSDNNRLVRLIADHGESAMFKGIKTMKYSNKTEDTKEEDFGARSKNLEASMLFFDSLVNTINATLAINDDALIWPIRDKINQIAAALKKNKKVVDEGFKNINQAIVNNPLIREGDVLIGTTDTKDLKAKSGNIFTLDFGFANVVSTDIRNRLVYMPKIYTGINIYFRPIDKNTRNSDFPRHYLVNKDRGPLYRVASVNSWRQHLSLSIGLTLGSMANSQFDNLLGNSALLVGPGYRFGRFFKVSSGLALMKRISKNPLISEKKVVAGSYLTVSADIDLLQAIKDFTSMFK